MLAHLKTLTQPWRSTALQSAPCASVSVCQASTPPTNPTTPGRPNRPNRKDKKTKRERQKCTTLLTDFFWQCAKFYENFMNFKTGQKTFHIILQFHKKIIATTSTSALTERSPDWAQWNYSTAITWTSSIGRAITSYISTQFPKLISTIDFSRINSQSLDDA